MSSSCKNENGYFKWFYVKKKDATFYDVKYIFYEYIWGFFDVLQISPFSFVADMDRII